MDIGGLISGIGQGVGAILSGTGSILAAQNIGPPIYDNSTSIQYMPGPVPQQNKNAVDWVTITTLVIIVIMVLTAIYVLKN